MKSLLSKWLAVAMAVALFGLLIVQAPAAAAGKKATDFHITMSVRASKKANFSSEIALTSKMLTRALKKAVKEQAPHADVLPDIELSIVQKEGAAGDSIGQFRLEQTGHLWKEASGERFLLPERAAALLIQCAKALRNQHYGKLTAWNEVKSIIPNKSKFAVTDIESGLTFHVQRRAGSDHADVQPLTKEDTRVMKEIYGGQWSWNRKAVLIHADGQWIAASMNGMPHGGDGIPENGFSGHFCIHFYMSSTHKSNVPDLAHQVMVHKAAGNLPAYFSGLPPVALARTFVAIMNHKEHGMLRQMAAELPEEQLASFEAEMESLSSIREDLPPKRNRAKDSADDPYEDRLTAELQLPVAIEAKGRSRHTKFHFTFQRKSADSPWQLMDVSTHEASSSKNGMQQA